MNLPRLDLPRLDLPAAPTMPIPTLSIPSHQIPRYEPLVVPPSDLRAPPGVKGGVNDEPPPKPTIKKPPALPKEVRMLDVPGMDLTIPVPTNAVLATAGTTAVVSVGVGMIATAIFKRLVDLLKPVIKKLLTRKKKNER